MHSLSANISPEDGSSREYDARKEKRKAQNRLAQRNYRKRMREIGQRAKSSPSSTESTSDATDSLTSTTPTTSSSSSALIVYHTRPASPDSSSPLTDHPTSHDQWTHFAMNKAHLHKLDRPKLNQMMEDLEKLVRRNFNHTSPSPRADQLLTLIQFNVFRALVANTASMGFTMEWLKESAISPWSTGEGSSIDLTRCPPSLRPTALQNMVPHHPWIDLLPLPKIRDNLLLADAYYDEDRLCNDIVEFCDVPNESTGLIVWGQPCDPTSWEVSETFLQNWAWVIRGCHEIQTSTNYWRQKRGEMRLRFDKS